VVRICDSATDARTLRLRLLEEIRRAVGFDAYAWLLTDPETSVGSAPLADVPCLPELPRLIALKYLTGINRWTSLHAPVGLLQEATGGDRSRSLLWQDLLRRYGVSDRPGPPQIDLRENLHAQPPDLAVPRAGLSGPHPGRTLIRHRRARR
jgi:hypothetical protein